MATNHNPYSSGTSTTGWTKFGNGAIAATSEGMHWKSTVTGSDNDRYLRISIDDSHLTRNRNYAVANLKVRRNSGTAQIMSITVDGNAYVTDYTYGTFTNDGWAGYSPDLSKVYLPTGQFITIPVNTLSPAKGSAGHWAGPGNDNSSVSADDNIEIYIYAGAGAFDFTITSVGLYDLTDFPAAATIDTNDATFTYTQGSNSLGCTFSLSPPNEAVETVSWDWGDGTTTTGNAVGSSQKATGVVKYWSAPGRYTVKCTTSNQWGQSTYTTQVVTVPWGTFSADFSYEANYLAVNVDASSSIAPDKSPIDTYAWNWGDGTTTAASASKYASHTYAQTGAYPIQLTVNDTATARTATKTTVVNVTAPPNPDNYFIANRTLLSVAFTPSITNGTSYSWAFGDGATSTEQSPTHAYDSPGTYAVTLTVNGNLTTTQNVTVNATYQALSDLTEALQLEVAIPHPAGTIYNRLPNPNGDLGAYGWVTPVSGSYVIGSTTATTTADHGIAGSKLIYTSSGSGTQTFYTIPVLVTAGQYASAQWVAPYVDGYYRVAVEALDTSGTVLGSGAQTGYLSSSQTTTARTTPYLLPTGTTQARLRVEHYSTTSNGVPAAGKILQLRRVMLATAATSAALTSNPYVETENWQDVIGPTSEISIQREALDVGTLTATILDSTFDPASSGTIRPGQAVRLRARTEDTAGNVAMQSVFTGTVSEATVKYNRGAQSAKSTRITLTATDNVTQLAQKAQPDGVALITELPHVLETAGVPYEINGSSGQIPTAQVVAVNENASVLDQVAITRDTAGGYAYVNRDNVLVALDPQHMPTVPVTTIDEAAFSDVDATFAMTDCINSVTVTWLRYSAASGETTEVPYGPYEDSASVEEWGRRPATFTMHGVENPTTIQTKANAILAANATPERRINSVSVPIRYQEDLHPGRALLDLYDLVNLRYERTETDEQARVTGISHTITPKSWKMELRFSPNGAVAPPQVVASPPALTASDTTLTGTSTGMAWRTGWTQFDTGTNRLQYTKVGNFHSLVAAIKYAGASADSLSTTTTLLTITNPVFVPPPVGVSVYAMTSVGGVPVRIIVQPTGIVQIQKTPSAAWSMANGDYVCFSATWLVA